MTRRTLIGLGLAAGGLVLGLRAWQASSREITVRYEAPHGDLTVIIRDGDGRKIRRTHFGAGIERQHAMRLPDGTYSAHLQLAGRPAVQRAFRIDSNKAVLIQWR